MTVTEFIRQHLKVRTNLSDEALSAEIQAIAAPLGYEDLSKITEEEAQFIAEEIDKSGGLSVADDGAIAPLEPVRKGGKKNAIQPIQSQSVEHLKPAVQNLKTAVASEADAMLKVFDQKAKQVEETVTNQIMARCKQINPNIIASVSQGLQEYTSESASFRTEIGSIFDEAFADLINTAP